MPQPIRQQHGGDLTNMTVTWSRTKQMIFKKSKYSEMAEMVSKHNKRIKLSLFTALKHTGTEKYATFHPLPWCNTKVKEPHLS
jgi:hypothetical protein